MIRRGSSWKEITAKRLGGGETGRDKWSFSELQGGGTGN